MRPSCPMHCTWILPLLKSHTGMIRRVAHYRPRLIRVEAARSQRKAPSSPRDWNELKSGCFWGFLCVDSTKKAISLPRSVLTGLSLSALSFMRNTMLLRKSEVPCVLEAPFCSFPPGRTQSTQSFAVADLCFCAPPAHPKNLRAPAPSQAQP